MEDLAEKKLHLTTTLDAEAAKEMAQIYCREDELGKLNKRYENLRHNRRCSALHQSCRIVRG